MDKILDIIRQVIVSPFDIFVVAVGLLFIIFGILAGVFKKYRWFIAFSNGIPKNEWNKIDFNSSSLKYYCIITCLFGLFLVLIPFFFACLNTKYVYRTLILVFVPLLFSTFMNLYFNSIKKNNTYTEK